MFALAGGRLGLRGSGGTSGAGAGGVDLVAFDPGGRSRR